MSKHWRKKQGKDQYFQKAKAEGYRARSAYKLEEIQDKFRILRPRDRVLDIGAAPGSWSQFAKRVVGTRGKVLAVDLKPIDPLLGVITIEGDIRDAKVWEQMQAAIGEKPLNTVLSDIAPNTSGIRFADHARSIELSLVALTMALKSLRRGGNFVTKVFMGGEFDRLFALTKRHFRRVNAFTPSATRKESKEIFIVGKGLKDNAVLDPDLGLETLLAAGD